MAELKRDKIKYIRDKAKSKYDKGTSCYICGSETRVDFHHYYSLTPLLDKWLLLKTKERPEHYTDEYIVIWRDEFIEDHGMELYEHAVTICHDHHLRLHSIYGRNPALATAKKQMRWVEIQKDKHNGVV